MHRAARIAGTLVAFAIVIVLAAGWYFRDYAIAYYHEQSAPDNVKALEAKMSLSGEGKRFYYGAAPQITDKGTVQKACAGIASEGIMGCFDGQRIYLLDITDQQFENEEPVTGAHEMLHAAFDDMSQEEKQRTLEQLETAVKQRNDAELNERIGKYKDRPAQLDEAFAILGSEVPDDQLPPELAKTYQRYFADRAVVVGLHQQFENQFDQLEVRINQLKQQLNAKKVQLDRDLASGNVSRYNSQVEPYNELVGEYNELINQYNDLGQRFNRAISR